MRDSNHGFNRVYYFYKLSSGIELEMVIDMNQTDYFNFSALLIKALVNELYWNYIVYYISIHSDVFISIYTNDKG